MDNNMLNNQNPIEPQEENKKKSLKSLFLWFGAHKAITSAIAAAGFVGVILGSLGGAGAFSPKGGNGGGDNPDPEPTPEPEPEPEPIDPGDALKFTATGSSTIGYSKEGTLTGIDIRILKEGGTSWELWDGTTKSLTDGESIYVKNNANTLSVDYDNYFYFTMSGEISASGNVNSMINYSDLTDYCYYLMFSNCINLTSAPTLPAETLEEGCYSSMFSNCTSLTTAPELPAETLAEGCYESMFSSCSSLTSAPELSSTDLAPNCYSNMFNGCEALTSAPELRAETLEEGCYDSMFAGCSSLTSAPELPAETLANDCYNHMFTSCINLTSAPALPAETLKDSCYYQMFKDCSNLKIREESGSTSGECKIFTCQVSAATRPVDYMFAGTKTVDFSDGIPTTNKTYYWENGLKFTGTEAGSTVGYKANGLTDIDIQVSYDNGITWEGWNGDDITLENVGDSINIKNNEDTLSDDSNNFQFTMDGVISASGNVNSMINYSELYDYCYTGMFSGCEALTSAPELPATTLADSCYSYMFSGCSNLTTASALPALTLDRNCYFYMFEDCSNLVSAPQLPAETLEYRCYAFMFSGCDLLTTAPTLPATNLAEGCYACMFSGCSNLTTAPALNATELQNYCYQYMFSGCSSLKIIEDTSTTGECKIFTCPVSAATSPVDNMFEGTKTVDFSDGTPTANKTYYWRDKEPLKFTATEANSTVSYDASGLTGIEIQVSHNNGIDWTNWLESTPITLENVGDSICVRNKMSTLSNGTYHFNFVMTGTISASGNVNSMINYSELSDYCYTGMFDGCSALTSAPELPATKLKSFCYKSMFADSGLTSAPKLPATTLDSGCYQMMFKDCTSLTIATALPATELKGYCYEQMFSGCSSLKIIEDISTTGENKIFTCSSTSDRSVSLMFNDTINDFDDSISVGYTYYWYKEPEPLKFTATQANSSVSYNAHELTGINIQVSYNNGNSWEAWNGSSITLENVGDSICVRNTENNLSNTSSYFQFTMTGKISASGSVDSMINYSELSGYCYEYLFAGCFGLTTAPELPATTLADSCYYRMFYACTSLTSIPELPAKTLVNDCYMQMFEMSSSLKISQDTKPTGEGGLIFTCPNTDGFASSPVDRMFTDTNGTFVGTPLATHTYYWYA